MSIGIVGVGTIGAGVAQLVAESRREVVLVDRDPLALQRAGEAIRRGLQLARLQRRTTTPASELLARVRYTTDIEELKDATLVIENVSERWDVKGEVYRRLDTIAPPQTCFAANTSAIPIARIAAVTTRPERVIGVHFMNPPALIPTVEVIRSAATSEETIAEVTAFLESLGQRPIVVRDAAGFVINRVLMGAVNEAAYVVAEGTAAPADVDRLFQGALGHKMGPLRTADLIGIDTVVDTLEVLRHEYGDKFRTCPLLDEMVQSGHLGRKSGRGFYVYEVREGRE